MVKSRSGFTLIEMMVAVGVIAIVTPVIFNLLFISFRNEIRVRYLKTVKNGGDFALSSTNSIIRQFAFRVVDCTTPTTEITTDYSSSSEICFRTKDSQYFRLYLTGGAFVIGPVGSNTVVPGINATITDNTQITISDLNISATKSYSFTSHMVSISFKVCKANTTEQSVCLNYASKAKIRNY